MIRRHQPPLLEALGQAVRAPSAPAAAPAPPRPAVQHPPARGPAVGRAAPGPTPPLPRSVVTVATPAPGSGARGLAAALRGRIVPIALLAVATFILMAVAAWSWGYARGEKAGMKIVLPHTTPDEAAVITGQIPNQFPETTPLPAAPEPRSTPVTASTARAATPVGMPPVTGPELREPGINYLHIARLTWRDADQAVRFLQKNGVRATCIPADNVDLAKAQANNRHFTVFVLDGIPSGQFKANELKRAELVATVRKLGKRWQREERGASDFAEVNWALFKGK